jgi:DNA-binding SARP family transcriptional activator
MVTEREQPSIHTLWRIELLGWLQARQGERVLTRFRSHKTGSLLAFLAYYADRSHPREVLIERLWPEGDPAAGRNRLRQSLSSLRRQLEPPEIPAGSVILADRYSVRLNPDACLIDVRQFEGALNAACGRQDAAGRAEHLASAVAYYRGALLPGFCDDWVLEERQRLAEAQIDALSQLSALSEEAGDWPTAIQYARRAVGADPLWEDPRATLIRLLVAAGHEEAARQQLLEFSQLLARELGAEPSEELQALLRERNGPRRRLLSGGSGSLRLDRGGSPAGSDPLSHVVPAAPPGASNAVSALDLAARDDPLPAATGCPGVLPLQFTRFFGREAEIETLLRLLSNLNTETR